MDSDSDTQSVPVPEQVKKSKDIVSLDTAKKQTGRSRLAGAIPKPAEEQPETILVVANKLPRKKYQPTEKQLKALEENRAKGLAKLTEQRRVKREEKEKEKVDDKARKEEAKQFVEEKRLDAAPKIREIDGSMIAMKKEMEELRKQLLEAKEAKEPKVEKEEKPKKKVKKIIYESDDEDAEEIVEVIRRTSKPKPASITGTALLDKLFFEK